MTESHIVEYRPHALRNLDLNNIRSTDLRPAIEDFSNQLAQPRLWSVLVSFDQLEGNQSASGGLIVTLTFIQHQGSTCDFDSILDSFESFLYGRFDVIINRSYREIHESARL